MHSVVSQTEIKMININETNKKHCCGCTACESVCHKKCISMQTDNEGFKYPVVDKTKCVNCRLCEKVCPILNKTHNVFPNTAYVVRNKNSEIVRSSTSGGAVTAFSKEIINNGGIVFGGAFDGNFYVKHTYAETESELSKFRSSKYVQSDMGTTFTEVKQQLDNGKFVMFTGTPCQVEGLQNYLRKPYDNLFTIDFVCRAVPSPLVWEKYREFMEKKFGSEITYANFREKTYGYHSANLTFRFANGKKSIENTNTDYMLKSFFKGICSRPSCYDCKFREPGRVSDLTVFDCWNITRYVNGLADDDKGYTAVIIQSTKGAKLFEKAKHNLIVYPADPKLLLENDGHMAMENPKYHKNRKEYFEMLNNGYNIEQVVKKYIPIKISRKIFGKFRGFFYKTGILRFLKKLKIK